MNDKMIEEMAYDIYWQAKNCDMLTTKSGCEDLANILVNEGYRKIKDNDLYIPEEYIEEFGNFIATSPQTKQTMETLIKAWQKETAKEILQSLLDFVNCEKINQGHSFEKIKETLIKVAKTYEVEVEE